MGKSKRGVYGDNFNDYPLKVKKYYDRHCGSKEDKVEKLEKQEKEDKKNFKRVIFSTYHCVSKDYVQRYIDEQTYRWNTREEKASYRFHDMFTKAIKSFDYNDVLSLSSIVDTEYRTFKHNVYFHWYDHKHRVA